MTFHLFQRTITRKGKKIKAWYYWYYDKQGKQVRKSCGTDGKPCLLKRDAEQFIESLKEKKELDNQKTFNEYCINFYTPNSRFIRKREARGYIFHDNTMYQKNLYLNRFLEAFGDTKVRDLTPGDVENWLIELPGSNSAKNHILAVISEVEEELYCDHLIDYEIHIRRFRRNTQQKGILTLQEIRDLFPVEYDDLIKNCGAGATILISNFGHSLYTSGIVGRCLRKCPVDSSCAPPSDNWRCRARAPSSKVQSVRGRPC